jgi:hypothetical protein
MQVAREAFEVPQHLEAGDAQAARAHRFDRGRLAVRMPDEIGGVQHDLREPGALDRPQLGLQRPRERDGVHPEVVEVHGFACETTSSKVTPPR